MQPTPDTLLRRLKTVPEVYYCVMVRLDVKEIVDDAWLVAEGKG